MGLSILPGLILQSLEDSLFFQQSRKTMGIRRFVLLIPIIIIPLIPYLKVWQFLENGESTEVF